MRQDVPVLEPNLGLAFVHAQLAGDVAASGGGGAVVRGEVLLELDELLGGDAGALAPLLDLGGEGAAGDGAP